MAMADQRAALAALLDTLPGVNGLERRPTSPNVRDAFPLSAEMTRGPGMTFDVVWRVIVWLGADERTAQMVGDELLDVVPYGLEEFAFVESAAFVAVAATGTGTGSDVYALEIRARCEE